MCQLETVDDAKDSYITLISDVHVVEVFVVLVVCLERFWTIRLIGEPIIERQQDARTRGRRVLG